METTKIVSSSAINDVWSGRDRRCVWPHRFPPPKHSTSLARVTWCF